MSIATQDYKGQRSAEFDFLKLAHDSLIDKFAEEVKDATIIRWPTLNLYFSAKYSFNRQLTRQLVRTLAAEGFVEVVRCCGIRVREKTQPRGKDGRAA